MERKDETLRERLLMRLPQPENFAAYQQKVSAQIAKVERVSRHEKWIAGALWLFAIVNLLFLTEWRGEKWMATPHGHLAEFSCLVIFIFGGVVLLGSAIRGNYVGILKEVKQLQLQVLELQAAIEKKS